MADQEPGMDLGSLPRISRRDFLNIAANSALWWVAIGLASCVPDQTTTTSLVGQEELVDFLNRHGQNPQEMILGKLSSGARLVGLGEVHTESDMAEFGVDVVAEAADRNLIQFLVLEIDLTSQPDVDRYLDTGEMNENLLQQIKGFSDGYLNLLKTARDKKLNVVCVDAEYQIGKQGEIDKNLIEYMENHSGDRGIFYAGGMHVMKYFTSLDDQYKNEYYAAMMLNGLDAETNNLAYRAYMDSNLNRPIGLDNISNTPFANITYGMPFETWMKFGKNVGGLVFLPPIQKIQVAR